jgi:hypothetical protein
MRPGVEVRFKPVCGRARLSSDVSEITIRFAIPPGRPMPNFAPSWNLALVHYWDTDIRHLGRSMNVQG